MKMTFRFRMWLSMILQILKVVPLREKMADIP